MSEVIELDQFIQQLEHAVDRFEGKTSISREDIRVLRAACNALERFDTPTYDIRVLKAACDVRERFDIFI
jgi:hypothetical protein